MLSYFERSLIASGFLRGNWQISRRVSTIFSQRAKDVPASGLILTLANTRMILIAVSSTVPEDPKSTLSSSLECFFSSSQLLVASNGASSSFVPPLVKRFPIDVSKSGHH